MDFHYKTHSVTSIYWSAATLKPSFFVPEELWSFVVWIQDLWVYTLWYLAWGHLQLILWIFGYVIQALYRPGSGHHINNLGTLGTLSCREWLMLKLGYTHTVTQGSLLKCGHISVTPFSSSDRQIGPSLWTYLPACYHWSVWFTFFLQPYVLSPHLLPLPCYPGLPRDVAYQLAESDRSFDAKTVCLCVCYWVLSQNF